MTLKNNRAPLPYNFKLCASFQNHQWIQTGVTVWKRSLQVKISHVLSRVTLKFYGWPWKTIGHFFYATSSCVHHFKAIGELKLELVWKCSIRVKIGDFLSCVTLKFDEWPWKTIGHLFYATSSFMPHLVTFGEFKLELQSGNPILVKIDYFFSHVTLKFDRWPWWP